ncbi:MAG TPA: 1-(5-phosphoribosyl)-5-[(5-phosphoribosylamino)methylideneamino]imidazole-4-carboxamide isomerase [Desulfatiglandales bacterium]|nr:1-(5-phosphoribosyl)-5-[(5-phosphoribosylamino)methylideneamino]imidazole-4-carboxamide isomerase [Desulfatiglandales bacterium]
MVVIPAIDIKDGRCVRLKQGQMSKETVYSEVPEEMAVRWYSEGAERLHIVDLDGAVERRPVNRGIVKKIVNSVPIPIQLGGGIRDLQTLKSYIDLGVEQIILGTAAFKDPGFIKTACEKFSGRVILGIDANGGRVAIEGWTQETDISPIEMARRYESLGISAIIYTDIRKDGMCTGPNIEATRSLAESISVPVIVSGGISGIDDVERILSLERYGVTGMITGRALYEGTLSLADAIKIVKKAEISG